MTFLLAKACSDGVLLMADSIAIPDVDAPERNAIKFVTGNRNGQACVVTFGGFAGAKGGIQSIDTLQTAVDNQPGFLPEVIRDVMLARLRDEADNGDWKDDATGQDDNAKRESFRQNAKMFAFVSPHPGMLWFVFVQTGQVLRFQPAAGYFMAISQPGPNIAAYDELKSLCNHGPQTIPQAAKSAAPVFQRATELFPYECCYPAVILRHTAEGVVGTSHQDLSELNAAGGT
ncbi:MAG: hypothetical protein HYV95_10085 [Opitutae bacterium]|nr:hypothetical protein [Opitutae bacterium]